MKIVLLISLFLAGATVAASPVAAQSRNSASVSSSRISSQKMNSQRVESERLDSGGPNVPNYTSYRIEELRGPETKTYYLPPTTRNTFTLQAEYLSPNPGNLDFPFASKVADVRLPLAEKGNLVWAPNQSTTSFQR